MRLPRKRGLGFEQTPDMGENRFRLRHAPRTASFAGGEHAFFRLENAVAEHAHEGA